MSGCHDVSKPLYYVRTSTSGGHKVQMPSAHLLQLLVSEGGEGRQIDLVPHEDVRVPVQWATDENGKVAQLDIYSLDNQFTHNNRLSRLRKPSQPLPLLTWRARGWPVARAARPAPPGQRRPCRTSRRC